MTGASERDLMRRLRDESAPTLPRTQLALAAYLDALGVSPHSFSVRGRPYSDDSIVLDKRPAGWAVFYTERGRETPIAVYENEADACADLLSRVGDDLYSCGRLIAGPAPQSEADEAFDDWLRDFGVTRDDLAREDWMYDEVPWVEGPLWRRYFIRTTTARRLINSL